MNDKINLSTLSSFELSVILENIKLGYGYISEQLTQQEINELISLLTNIKHSKKVSKEGVEKQSNLTLVVNTVITAILGSCLGLMGFVEFDINDKISIIILIIFAIVVGSYFGWYTYNHTKKENKAKINEQKLLCLQVEILEILNKRLNSNLQKVITNLNNKLLINTVALDTKEEVSSFITSFENIIINNFAKISPENRKVYNYFNLKLNNLKKNYINPRYINPNFKLSLVHNFIKLDEKSVNLTLSAWVNSNFQAIFIDSVTIIAGTVASLFVYFNSIPIFLDKLNLPKIEISDPKNRIYVSLGLISLAVIYLLFTLWKKYKKAFVRNEEKYKMQEKIAKLEFQLLNDKHKLKFLNKINNKLELLFFIEKTDDHHS